MNNQITFPNGLTAPKLGQGTWYMGDDPKKEDDEINALRTGIDQGLTLIDTAEKYGKGNSEKLVGKAIKDVPRDDLFLVSKIAEDNAGEERMFDSIDQTLQRLGVNELDMYLLHMPPTNYPLQETVDVFEELVKQGKIKGWGVSNFDTPRMNKLVSLRDGENVQTNQVFYNLAARGIEYSLTDFMEERNMPLMAYSPVLGQDPDIKEKINKNAVVNDIANKYDITIIQLLLAWVYQQKGTIPIPKASSADHTKQNAAVRDITFTKEELNALDKEFPAPNEKTDLEIR